MRKTAKQGIVLIVGGAAAFVACALAVMLAALLGSDEPSMGEAVSDCRPWFSPFRH